MPGGYLMLTRYPGVLPVVGFLWLELLPLTAYLYFVIGLQALLYPFLHIVFLGLYELGYVFNDRAQTASERPRRARYAMAGELFWCALLLRVLLFVIVTVLVDQYIGLIEALSFAISSLVIVALLLVHTSLGELREPLSRLRLISFAWLALSKYGPAALALVPMGVVLPALVWIFLVYGAGRVVDYTVNKVSPLDTDIPDLNGLWYVAALPSGAFMCFYLDNPMAGLAILGIFGAYYAVSLLKRVWGRL